MQELKFCGKSRLRDLGRLKEAYLDVAKALKLLERGKSPDGPIHRVVLVHAERGLGKTRLVMELYRWLSIYCDLGNYWPDACELEMGRVAVMPSAAVWWKRSEENRKALGAYNQAQEIFGRLAGLDRDNAGWQRDLAICRSRIGDLYAKEGNFKKALAEYGKAQETFRRLAGLDRDNTERQSDLAICHRWIGDTRTARGDTDGALEAYNQAQEIFERLADLDPDDTRWQFALALGHFRIGDTLAARGEADAALEAHGKHLETVERLADLDPDDTRWQSVLALGHFRIGDMRAARGEAGGALEACGKALEISERATAGDGPDGTHWRHNLALGHGRIGGTRAARGEADGVPEADGKALETARQLAGLDPDNAEWQRDLAAFHFGIGDTRAARGDTDGRLEAYGKALEIMERLAGLDPDNAEWQRDLAVCHSCIGATRATQRDCGGALEAYGCNNLPPFVWWGLQVADSPTSTDTVYGGLHNLLPHVVEIQTSRLARFAHVVVDTGVDIALGVVDAFGIGVIKTTAQGILKICDVLNPSSDVDRASGEEQLESVIDATMEDLDKMFSPRSDVFARVPLVVFVDDAQFADRDPTMVDFLERLIARSAKQRWPLLLVITHWSRELTAGDGRTGGSRVARVLRRAGFWKGREEPGESTDKQGGTLEAGHCVEIDLGSPVEDLAPALTDLFPGLGERTVEEIVEKSGGNPRKLEQIAARMERKPAWFIDGSTGCDLTGTGREKVLELSDLPIDEVVLERLRDMPESIRRAVSLASVIGPRFVVDLVDRLAEAHFGEAARRGLEESETTYRYVRDVLDDSRDDIASFAERLFIEAAQEYRSSGLAGTELGEWPGDGKLYEILDDLLDRLIDEPEAFDRLGRADRAEALKIAVERMERDRPHRAGLALAHLIGIEKGQGNFESSNRAADRFIKGLRQGTWTLDEIPFTLADEVGMVLDSLVRASDAESLYNDLLRRSEVRARLDPTNPGWQRDLAVSHERTGGLLRVRGDAQGALEAFVKALEIMERLATLDPTNTGWQQNLAIRHTQVGQALRAQDDAQGAQEAFEKALEIDERLAALDPANTEWQYNLAISHGEIGKLLRVQGDAQGALEAFEKALEISGRFAALDPTNTGWQHNLAVSHTQLGQLLWARGDAHGAQEAYGKAREIRERLAGRSDA